MFVTAVVEMIIYEHLHFAR